MLRRGDSSAQDFAFTAKSVKTCKLSQKNLPLAEGDLKWTDSVTGRPKAELIQIVRFVDTWGLRFIDNRIMIRKAFFVQSYFGIARI